MSKVEKKVGNTMDCGTCGLRLICRNKTYAAYEDHPERTVPQWQNDKGGAHYKCIGPEKFKCLDENGKDIPPKLTDAQKIKADQDKISKKEAPKVGNGLVQNDLMNDDDSGSQSAPEMNSPQITQSKGRENSAVLEPLDEFTAPLIRNDAILLYKVRKVIIDTVSKLEKNPHPGMIWEMTAILYNKHFGEKKQ